MSNYIANTIGWLFPAALSKTHSVAAKQDFIAAKDNAVGLGGNIVTLGMDIGHTVVATGGGAITASHAVGPLTIVNGGLQTATYTLPHLVPAALAPATAAVTGLAFTGLSTVLVAAVTNPLAVIGFGATVGLAYSYKSLKEGAIAISEMPGNALGAIKTTITGTNKAVISKLLATKEYLDPNGQNGFGTEGKDLTSETINLEITDEDYNFFFNDKDDVSLNFANAKLQIVGEPSAELFSFEETDLGEAHVAGQAIEDGWELIS